MPFNTLADDLQRLVDATDAIGQAIIDAGGTVNEYDRLEEYPADIKSINRSTTSIDITENGSYYAGEENTITASSFPITIRNSVGTPMKHVTVDGNMQQNGTPTPQNPIQPQECGEMTDNLFDEQLEQGTLNENATPIGSTYQQCKGETSSQRVRSINIIHTNGSAIISFNNTKYNLFVLFFDNDVLYTGRYEGWKTDTFTVNSPYIGIVIKPISGNISPDADDFNIMINSGSTPLPYEPYGYMIPISSGGANLFDYSAITTGYRIQWTTGNPYADDTAIMSDFIPVTEGDYALNISLIIIGYDADKSYIGVYRSEKTWEKRSSNLSSTFTVLSGTNVKYVRLLTYSTYDPITNTLMFNHGSIPLPYEPYNRTTSSVYLGEVPTTRKIKKLVLDGTENWKYSTTSQAHWIENVPNDYDNTLISRITTVCTHYKCIQNNTGLTGMINGDLRLYAKGSSPIAHELYIKDETYTSADDFKAYLAAQYAVGTPVTIWYVLAEPTTTIVNKPIRKIGDYVDTVSADINLPLSSTEPNIVDVETLLKPSSASFTYNIKNEYIGYNEINVDVPNTYTVADEGKVVSNGSLVSQTAKPTEITTNDTYDTTTYNSVTVNVENSYTASDEGKVVNNGSLVSQTAKPDTITSNNTYDTTMYNSVTVDVSSELQEPKDVNFYDYEGTLVKSYTATEFANISELPSNPSHAGLTAQGWNWSLVDAKAYVAKYKKLNIGQMYITSDGKTRIYITLTEGRTSPILQLYIDNVNTELDVDWGDGSTHSTFTTTTAFVYISERHYYATPGSYVIAITVISGSFTLQSQTSGVSSLLWNGNNDPTSADVAYNNSIKKVEIGTKVATIIGAFRGCYSLSSITIPTVTKIRSCAFYYCHSLTSITIPNTNTSVESYTFNECYSLSSIAIPNSVTGAMDTAFQNCYSLSSITIPDTITSIGSAFKGCSSLSSITIPNGVTSIGSQAFYNCYALSSIAIPNTLTSIGTSIFQNCYSLSSITIPNGVTSIGSQAFYNCYALSSIAIPDSVISIGTYAFNSCTCMESIKFKPTTPPSVSNSNTWEYVPTTCIIYVPRGTLNAYKTATNYPNPSRYTYIEY